VHLFTYSYDIFDSKMICAIESKYNEKYLKEVDQYGRPHISEKVEYLAFDYRYL